MVSSHAIAAITTAPATLRASPPAPLSRATWMTRASDSGSSGFALGTVATMAGIAWLLVALGLWALQPWARAAAMIIAGFSLFEAVLAFIQFPGTGIGFGMALLPGVILYYLSTAEVKEAFGLAAPSGQV